MIQNQDGDNNSSQGNSPQSAETSELQGNNNFSENSTTQKQKPDVPFLAQVGIGCASTLGILIMLAVLSTFYLSSINNEGFQMFSIVVTAIYFVGIVGMNIAVYQKKKWGGFIAGSVSVFGLIILLFGLCVGSFSRF